MKILKIEIENLNSLKGKWVLDFTDEEYEKNHRQFVIWGENGSGKTTILDAITLALYGKTPRQQSISASSNELMTRGTGFCSARVYYECRKKTYVSEFSQRRARDNARGNLQGASGQIKDSEGQSLYSGAPSKMEEATKSIIGLDYSEFCRSILLAQGEFDKFISGSPRDRASILSKLNGTEFYKKVAIEIGKKFTDVNSDYEKAKIKRNSVSVLSEEKILENKKELKSLKEKIDKNTKAINELQEAEKWLELLQKKDEDLKKAQRERKEYEEKAEKFLEKKQLLEKADKALLCKEVSVKFYRDEKECNNIFEEIKNLKEDLEKSEKLLSEKECAEKKSLQNLENAEKKLEENKKIWREVRDLDLQNKPFKEAYEKAWNDFEKIKKEKEDSEKKATELEKSISEYTKKYEDAEKYIRENSFDEEIEKNISLLKEKFDFLKKNFLEISRKDSEISGVETEKKKFSQDYLNAKKVYEESSKELETLVHKEFLSISSILRKGLHEGSPCPVCGSIYSEEKKSSCPAHEGETFSEDKKNEIVVNVSKLDKFVEESSSKITALDEKIKNCDEEISRLEKEKEDLIFCGEEKNKEIKDSLSDFGFKDLSELDFSDEKQSEEIISILEKRMQLFKNQKTDFENIKPALENAKIRRAGIEIEKNCREYQEAENELKEKKNTLDDLCKKRKELFGDKNADEEEEKFDLYLKNIKKESDNNQKERIEVERKTESLKMLKKTKDEEFLSKNEKLKKSEEDFEKTLMKNGFSCRKEFDEACLSDEELKELKDKKEKLLALDSSTKKFLDSALEEKEKSLSENKTSLTFEDVKKKLLLLTEENSSYEHEIGSINQILKSNKEQMAKAEEIEKELSEIDKKRILWNSMKSFIGTKGGEDFEEFVQAMAFKNLLVRASRYVYGITGKYHLVQIPGKVDFLVHDDNYPDPQEDRPVSNLSGGERFIISLSLALGIAELASRSVHVDSLFLDEGFGTLSGEPLNEAVTALKSLQTSGKMLGIITHMDAVINEFDLRIHAESENGVSRLEGPGIRKE